eukprot:353839-Chlamydomonas_euryale.AAC.7
MCQRGGSYHATPCEDALADVICTRFWTHAHNANPTPSLPRCVCSSALQAPATSVNGANGSAASAGPGGSTSFFGVSPPLRSSGAVNPLARDAGWTRSAMSASRTNLQALRELDAASGRSFLRGDLLVGSPPVHLGGSPSGSGCSMGAVPMHMPNTSSGGSSEGHGMPFACQTQYFVVQ